MGWNGSGSGVGCKKHPKHMQSPGVCSCCLREKLSEFNSTSTSTPYWLSPPLSSSSSSYSSPSIHQHQQEEDQNNMAVSSSKTNESSTQISSIILKNDNNKDDLLRRSHSMEVVVRKRVDDDSAAIGVGVRDVNIDVGKKKKKKGGFWLRLLSKPTSNSTKTNKNNIFMMHSKTMTETRTQRL